MKILTRIDKFYYAFGVVLLVLSAMVIISLRGIFSALKVAGEIDEALLNTTLPRVNSERIDEALSSVNNKQVQTLDLKQ